MLAVGSPRSVPRRKKALRICSLALVVMVLGIAGSCTTVRPPDPAMLRDPVSVFVARVLAHEAILLPDENGRYTQWGFGDRRYMTRWDWTQYFWGAWLGIVGIFGQPTDGVVERIDRFGRTREELERDTGMQLFEIRVERERALALQRRLIGKCGPATAEYPYLFTTDDHFSLWWDNCQNAVAGWCRELGCEISPWRVVPRWGEWSVTSR